MEELLQRLERKIKDLVAKHDHLKNSHTEVNKGQSSLIREKELLMLRQQKAIAQIQTLVTRLKAIEKII